ncbi:MAG: Mut7-C ubiquitin/RNAse domain-containing protein, partial [Deltaproteobacteria bacterium]|nr:Mut7-C ubiquitin/RNAse domain-containing protein [Deltaproteobacteria bacterium]
AMPGAHFRFYEELNDFLPEQRKKTDFEAGFKDKRTIKDMIESIGVPHPEIDLILVNGKSVNFDYILRDKDRVSVYPTFESINIADVTRLKKRPLKKSRFIADINLRDIVRYMRAMGLDLYFDPSLPPRGIIEISKKEKRIILTKSKKLLKFKDVTHGIFLRPGSTEEQIRYVIDYLDIRMDVRPFSRCLGCNNLLENIQKQKIKDRIPPKTMAFCNKYSYCRRCDKIYWEGTHVFRMKKVIEKILGR